MVRKRRAILTPVVSALVLVAGVGVISASLLAAKSNPNVPDLACDEIALGSGEGASSVSGTKTPEEAVLRTDWLDILKVPGEARTIVETTDLKSVENGIVPLEKDADGTITDVESQGGQEFQMYVGGDAVARFVVARGEDGTFHVTSLAHC